MEKFVNVSFVYINERFYKKISKIAKVFLKKHVLNKTTQGDGKVFLKNAQVLNKATQGELFFQKQLKPMGYY